MRKRAIAIGLCIVLCTGCDSNYDNEKKTAEAAATTVLESATATPIPEAAIAPSPSGANGSPSDSFPVAEQSPAATPDPLQRYIDAIPGDHADQEVVFSAEEDLDLDGQTEVVLGLGTEGGDFDLVDDLYVLRVADGIIMRIGDNLAGDGYGTYKVQLVQLECKSQQYIYSGVSNGASLYGFQLFELINGLPTSIVYSASVTGAGEDDLFDKDGNGKFDGYIQGRTSYDVFYYGVRREFDWSPDTNKFEQVDTSVDLPVVYPEKINEVIYQYLSLRILDDGYSDELKQRLSELCAMPDPYAVPLPDEIWGAAVYDAAMEVEGSYTIDTDERGDAATAIVTAITIDNKTARLTFELEIRKNQWRIVSIMD